MGRMGIILISIAVSPLAYGLAVVLAGGGQGLTHVAFAILPVPFTALEVGATMFNAKNSWLANVGWYLLYEPLTRWFLAFVQLPVYGAILQRGQNRGHLPQAVRVVAIVHVVLVALCSACLFLT